MSKKLTTEEWIKKASQIHQNKYDYSKVKYINKRTKVCIICLEHGEFWQRADSHIFGCSCLKCSNNNRKLTKNQFIENSNKKHNFKYDYSKVKYVDSLTKVIITCPEHGEFEQTPEAHSFGNGCKKCASVVTGISNGISRDEFISRAIKVHGNIYDYSKVEYKNTYTKVEIICKKHSSFWQRPDNHLQRRGCSKCSSSHGELKILKFLEENNIEKTIQECFKDSKNPCINPETGYFLPFDFYLPDYNLCIEFDGLQHFKPVEYFGGEKIFLEQKFKDNLKTQFCKDNGIKLLRIPYWKIKNIERILALKISKVFTASLM